MSDRPVFLYAATYDADADELEREIQEAAKEGAAS
jgi:hypothetical protein